MSQESTTQSRGTGNGSLVGPWMDTEAARAIGPIEVVAAPHPIAWIGLFVGIVLSILLSPIPIGVLGSLLLLVGFANWFVALLAVGALVAWFFGSVWLLGVGIRRLKKRILVGVFGLAEWSDAEARVVYWETLGNLWEVAPARDLLGRLVLTRSDGQTWTLLPIYHGSRQIANRILEERERNRAGRQCEREDRASELRRVAVEQVNLTGRLAEGPWLYSEAAQRIGPLEAVYAPGVHYTVVFWLACLSLLALNGLAIGAVVILCLTPGTFRIELDYWLLGFEIVAVLGVLVFTGWGLTALWRRLHWRILVGRRGLAEWHPVRQLVILWVELGETWFKRPVPFPESNKTSHPVVLVLEHLNGRQMILTTYFSDIERVVYRVESERTRYQGLTPAERQRVAAAHGAAPPQPNPDTNITSRKDRP